MKDKRKRLLLAANQVHNDPQAISTVPTSILLAAFEMVHNALMEATFGSADCNKLLKMSDAGLDFDEIAAKLLSKEQKFKYVIRVMLFDHSLDRVCVEAKNDSDAKNAAMDTYEQNVQGNILWIDIASKTPLQ